MDPYPLIFQPILKPKIWGGRRLATRVGKHLPPGETIGESWEVADLEDDQSVVATGPARGKTLGALVREWGVDLTGRAPLFDGRFPLLIKFLDACDTLSLQVHPDEATAKRLGGRVRVKNEAWYVVDADHGGFIYRGLRDGVDADALQRAIRDRRVASVLNRIDVRKGHCYYLPSGTLHALGAGVVVAEVQTPSDITYRVYDWDRIDATTGAPRELHVRDALACTSFAPVPTAHERPSHVASVWAAVTQLVKCDSFVIERVRLVPGVEQPLHYGEMVIWIVLDGSGRIDCDAAPGSIPFRAGDTVLIPAALPGGRVATDDPCMWLEVTVPIASSLGAYDRPGRRALMDVGGSGPVKVSLNVPNDDTKRDAS